MGSRRTLGAAVVVALLVSLVCTPIAAAVPPSAPVQVVPAPLVDQPHVPPVDALISDPFRAPEHAFGPGNRGIEYDTADGQVVSASAPGRVIFAGQVGGNLFVTIDHGAGIWTTVGYVGAIEVQVGEEVSAGQRIATAGERLHFSARHHGDYFDPELLFGAWRVVVRLVPEPG